MKKIFNFATLIVALVLFVSACTLPSNTEATGETPIVPLTPTAGIPLTHTATPAINNANQTPIPTAIFTASIAPTNSPAATATLTNEQLYSACPTASLNEDPNTKKPLIFVKDPYPGVLCEYEVYFKDRDYFIDLADGQRALIADWTVGKFWNPITGALMDGCPTGRECEGTWVMTSDGSVPAGDLAHVYVYADGHEAINRFLGAPNVRTSERNGSFACEYLVYSSQFGPHDNRNIRVPEWAKDFGSIYGHTGCVDFAGNPGETTLVEATPKPNTTVCEQPTKGDEWIWRQNEFWHYNGDPISFQVPNWIEKVLYEDNTNSNIDLTATNGQQVTNAVQAKAFCE